jgi:hypothetical protein
LYSFRIRKTEELTVIQILAALLLSFAQAETRPFEPAYAADQPTVAFDSMFREMLQFQNFSSWATLKHELAIKQKMCTAASQKLERLRKLSPKLTTPAELEAAVYRVEICAAEAEPMTGF